MSTNPHDRDELSQELDQALANMSPEEMAMLDAGGGGSARADERGRVRGQIIAIRNGDVFVDIGGKSEAFLSTDEFEPDDPPQVGRTLDFIMHGLDRESGLMRLSLKQARLEADFSALQPGDVIEGRVTGVNIGGLELSVKNLRAFMPKSQVDLGRIEDFAPYIGRRLECQITEIDRKGKTLVVSRRKLLEKEREETREQAKYSLAEGQTRPGVVKRLTDFGAFVDIGGIEGLLHVSDMSHSRVRHPKEVLKEGDKVEVKVLKVDLVKDRISLGLKQLQADPWNVIAGNYRVGQHVTGKVTRLMNFGAFVEVEPGVEALLPVSEMSWTKRVNHPSELFKEGDSLQAVVLSVDEANRKMSLSFKALGQDPWTGITERYAPDAVVSGLVTRLVDFGAFIQLEEGVEGLAHISELSDKRIRTAGDAVKVGEVVKARIKAVDAQNRRISLTLKGAAGSAEAPVETAAAPRPAKRKKPLRGGLE